MITTIIKREILEYLKSAKFLIGLSITVILITISTIINIQDFKLRQQDYLDAKREMTGDTFYIRVFRQPQVLSTLVQGKDRKLGNRAQFTYLDIPYRTSGYMGQYTSQHHRYLAGFASVDFAFVVRVVLSLMVIFLAYNSISEEKTHGTLKLMLANRLPRDQLLLGKFIGGLLVVLGSLLISAIISLLIMLFHPAISVAGSDWGRILGLLGMSALYLICFYTLSLFVSVIVNRPSISLMVLLQVWIFLIIIYPNLGVIAAEKLYRLPSQQEIGQQKKAAFQPYEEEFKKVREEFHNLVAKRENVPKEISLKNVELNAIRAEKEYQVDTEFSKKLTRQMELAQTISILSPAVVYDQAASRLARTGLAEHERFIDGVYNHWQKHVELTKLWRIDREALRKKKLPEFTYPSETTAQSFVATLPQWLILIAFSIIFFALAYTAFLKKDVR